jgi:PAS domain S-box-containing protein
MGRARRLRIGLTARVRLATLIVALALGAVFALLLHTVDVSRARDTQARHSSDVLESAAAIEGSVIDLESGLRGYIISRQTRFLEPYQRARATQPARLKRLEQLVMDNPSQEALARELATELNSYVSDYGVPLIAAVGANRRIGLRRLSEGKQRVDIIRGTIGRFTTVEDTLQAERRASANAATHRARVLAIIAMVLLVLAVIASGFYASRFVAEPLRSLARSARRLAAGRLEERVKVAGAAEVGDLSVAFNQMASALQEHTQELELLSESSSAQFSAIFEQTPLGLTLFDRDLHCIRCNAALGELAGVTASDQRGRTVTEVFGHFEPDLTAEFGRVLQQGRPIAGLRIMGGGRNCTVGLFPVRKQGGDLIGVAAVVADVTEREQRLERERVSSRRARQLERLASTISEAVTPEDVSRAVVAEAVLALDGEGGAVALLDEPRQMLDMAAGIGWTLEEQASFENIPLSRRTPLTDAVRTRRVVHVENSLALPLLSGPRCLGGLLVTFSSPREFTPDQLEFAEEVAERCASGVARALLYEREHETAAALQRSLMPRALPMLEDVIFGARFRPAGTGEVVGGDFYDVVDLGDGCFVAWIGDVQGKGPQAAAVAALARYTLRAETRHESRPGQLLQALNEAVLSQSEPGDRLLTAACITGTVTDDHLDLELAIAGHPHPLLMRHDRPCAEWGPSGPLIGFENAGFTSKKVALEPGELLVLYTDGLTDAHAPRRVVVAEDLCRKADQLDRSSLGDVLDWLLESAGADQNDLPRDDIALLGIQFAPSGSGAAAPRDRAATLSAGAPATRLNY